MLSRIVLRRIGLNAAIAGGRTSRFIRAWAAEGKDVFMKYAFFDGSAGLSGDMILAALLDLGVSPSLFKKKIAGLKLPVQIEVTDVKRSSLRGLKVDVRVKKSPGPRQRKWAEVESLIVRSPFSTSVKQNSLAVFKNLFEAESKVHGHPFAETHLHEAAADDAVVDILGSCFLAEELGIGVFYASPLNVGSGWIKTSHGVLPVPPPAVAELLKRIPAYSAHVKEELVTPTGAAIVATWVKAFTPFPELAYEKIGYGAGSRNFPDFPNILRVFYGEESEPRPERPVFQVEANIDDSSPQVLAHFIDQALALGALDASLTPVVMKKNRLGTKLTMLADPDKIDGLIRAVFRETSSIGVRYFPVARRILARRTEKVRVFGEEVGIKISTLDGQDANIQPEFSDCLKAARKSKRPVKEVLQRALQEYFRKTD